MVDRGHDVSVCLMVNANQCPFERVVSKQPRNDVLSIDTMRNLALFMLLLSIPWQAYGQQPSSTQVKFFESKIRPALTKYCYECHSVEAGDSQGGLLLDTKQGMLQGGNGGPALVPGDAEGSMIWEAITWQGYEMPPSQKMPASVIADFKEWIEMGAPDPREREITNFTTKITEKDIENARREHWAFQAPSKRLRSIGS